jgi:hypothetical protein
LLSSEKWLVAASMVARSNCNDSIAVISLVAAQQNSKCEKPQLSVTS